MPKSENDALLRVTLVRSTIGRNPKQRKTVRALGLRRIGQSIECRNTASIRGMLAVVHNLIRVE